MDVKYQPDKTMSESGRLIVSGSVIRYEYDNQEVWTLPLSDIAVMGEYTTPNGPYVDDYFFVFVRPDGRWFQASCYASRQEDAIELLRATLNAELTTGLWNSADWMSRIIWPPTLADHPLFDISPVAPQTLRQRLRNGFLGERELMLTPEVWAHLGQTPTAPTA